MNEGCYPFGLSSEKGRENCCVKEADWCDTSSQCRGKRECVDGKCSGISCCEQYCLLSRAGALAQDQDCCIQEGNIDVSNTCSSDSECKGRRTCDNGFCQGEDGCEGLLGLAKTQDSVIYDVDCLCVPHEPCGHGPGGIPCKLGCSLFYTVATSGERITKCTRQIT